MAERADLVAEIDTTLDGTGNFYGDWIDSGGIFLVRVVNDGSAATIEESSNQTDIVQAHTTAVAAEGLPYALSEIPITARYFRVHGHGDADAALHVVVRVLA